MSVRLSDVATRARVSPGLVSKVLNNRDGVRVPPETRQRILTVADELGYHPSAAARSLRSGKTRNVALVFHSSDETSWYYAYGHIASQLARFLYSHDHRLLIQPLENQEQTLAYLSTLARTRACDLVILWGSERYLTEQGKLLEKLGMPFVVKGRFERDHPNWAQIDFDHEGMMRQAVAHLAGAGHRRIAYIGYDADESFRYCLEQGFSQAMHDLRDHEAEAALVRPIEYNTGGEQADVLVERWLSLPEEERPTGIVIGADISVWDGIEIGLARRGMVIGDELKPGQMAVTGNASHLIRLLFGQGMFMDTDFFGLSEALVADLLAPMLTGMAVEQPVHRYLPPLQPTPSRRLQVQRIHPRLFEGSASP